ncbi:MAG: long-chain fatty acid--CoA ligase [Hyphomicrobiales bacterium]|nr:MAG: long-chain fatty acid--CoA ligase [Hyphomicrobiales bacterium]
MNLSMTLRTSALRLPTAPAISSDDTTLTYGEFEQQVGRLAQGLRVKRGLVPSARVGIAMENSGAYLVILYALWRAGLVAVPMNAKLHAKEMAFILSNAQCRLCFASPDIADRLADLGEPLPPVEVISGAVPPSLLAGDAIETVSSAPGDEAWLFYTSGTTGRPKGAILTHRNLLFMSHAYYADIDQVDERDVKIHAAPLSHGSGLYGLPHIAKGSHQIVLGGSFDPDHIFALLSRHRNVTLFGAPTMVTRLMNHPLAGSAPVENLKTLYFGGAPMYVEDLKQALGTFGPRLTQIYGQGESPMTITSLPKHLLGQPGISDELLASTGFARTGVEVRVVDENGRDLPAGETGEVVTRSDCVMRGYLDNAEANAKALRDGWLWTGDLGTMSKAGFLTLKDRSKDLIISGGSNIYPREIEEVLLMHPAVLECAVVSRPHKDWGEEVVAFIQTHPGAEVTDAALDEVCLNNIARFKRPRAYYRVEGLPKSSYGKILKTELRARLDKEAGNA